MLAAPGQEEPAQLVKILIPIAQLVDREKLARVLHALSAFPNPLIVLLHVIELPSRTTPLEIDLVRKDADAAEAKLNPVADWLKQQHYNVVVKIAVARNAIEGIITEANTGSYSFVVLMKRRIKQRFGGLFQKSTSEAVIRAITCPAITMLVDIP